MCLCGGSIRPRTIGARAHQTPAALVEEEEFYVVLNDAKAARAGPTVFGDRRRKVAGVVVTVGVREGEGGDGEEGDKAEELHDALLSQAMTTDLLAGSPQIWELSWGEWCVGRGCVRGRGVMMLAGSVMGTIFELRTHREHGKAGKARHILELSWGGVV